MLMEESHRRNRAVLVYGQAIPVMLLLIMGLITGLVLAIALGPVPIEPSTIGRILLTGIGIGPDPQIDATIHGIVLDLRLPRALAAMSIGCLLAVGGATMQGLFRNPLADPGLLGVSSGAALATAAFIVFGDVFQGLQVINDLRQYALPGAAFLGGLSVVLLTQRLAYREGRTDVATMLLAGIAVTAIVMAGIGLLTFVSDDAQLRSITFWTLGSLGGASWPVIAIVMPVAVLTLLVSLRFAPVLDGLMLGEREAFCLGFKVETAKRLMILTVAAGVGTAVAFTGLIGFIGIVAPHIIRLVLGPSHRLLLMGSALLGGLLLLLADIACRIVVAPAELPIGIVTSLVGAPFFLVLLARQRQDETRAS
jgi:iron complex transport system permease protein